VYDAKTSNPQNGGKRKNLLGGEKGKTRIPAASKLLKRGEKGTLEEILKYGGRGKGSIKPNRKRRRVEKGHDEGRKKLNLNRRKRICMIAVTE